MENLLNGYLGYIYNCKSRLNKVIYNWLLESLIIYTHNNEDIMTAQCLKS